MQPEPFVPAADVGSALVRRADQKHCHACSRLLHMSAHTCPSCGASQELGVSSAVAQHPTSRAVTILPRDHVHCRGCGAGIHQSAVTCPRCGAQQSAAGALTPVVASATRNPGTPWLSIVSLVLGVICVLALLDDSDWDGDAALGLFALALPGLITGIAAVSTATSARGVAIAGIVLSSIALLASVGYLGG